MKELTEWFASRAVGPRRRRAQWPSYRGWLLKLSTLNRQKLVAPDSCAIRREIRLQRSGFHHVRCVEIAAFCEQARKLFLRRDDFLYRIAMLKAHANELSACDDTSVVAHDGSKCVEIFFDAIGCLGG